MESFNLEVSEKGKGLDISVYSISYKDYKFMVHDVSGGYEIFNTEWSSDWIKGSCNNYWLKYWTTRFDFVLREFWDYIKYQLRVLFNDQFEEYFSTFTFHPFHCLTYDIRRSANVVVATDVFKYYSNFLYRFYLIDSLYIDHPYCEDNFLVPSQEYLELRVNELLEDVDVDLRNAFTNWKNLQLELKRDVFYVCSLNS